MSQPPHHRLPPRSLRDVLQRGWDLTRRRHAPEPVPTPNIAPLGSSLPGALRQIRMTSARYFDRAERYWHWLFLSLGLDAFLFMFPSVQHRPDLAPFLEAAIVCAAVGALLFLFHDTVWRAILWARDALTRVSQRTLLVGFLVLVALLLVEFGSRLYTANSLLGVLTALVVAGGALMSLVRGYLDKLERDDRYSSDPALWIEHSNRQLFWLAMGPAIPVRSVSALTALYALIQGDVLWYLVGLVITLVLFGMLQPHRESFMLRCRHCGIWTSKALAATGSCLGCDSESFRLHLQTVHEANIQLINLLRKRFAGAIKTATSRIEEAISAPEESSTTSPTRKLRFPALRRKLSRDKPTLPRSTER